MRACNWPHRVATRVGCLCSSGGCLLKSLQRRRAKGSVLGNGAGVPPGVMVAAPWQKTTAVAPVTFSLSAAVLAAWRALRSERRDELGEATLRAPPLRGDLNTSTSVSGACASVVGRSGACTSACSDASQEIEEIVVGRASSCSRAW